MVANKSWFTVIEYHFMFCILDELRLDINDKHMKQQVMLVISNFEYGI